MIKSIFLPTPPSMSKVGAASVLTLFDPLKELTSEEVIDDHGEKLVKKTYRDKSGRYQFILYSFPSLGLTARLFDCYLLIMEVEPELLRVDKLSNNSFLVTHNYYYDPESRRRFVDCMDELVRVANTALWRASGDKEEAIEDVEYYIKTYVKWEKN